MLDKYIADHFSDLSESQQFQMWTNPSTFKPANLNNKFILV